MRVVLFARWRGATACPERRMSVLAGLCASLALGVVVALSGPLTPAWSDSNCLNEAFRNGPSSHLPDCRAYELVSPADKNGGGVDGGVQVESVPAPQQSAADGEAVTYASQTAFTSANPVVGLPANQYVSKRGSERWSTEAISPSQTFPGGELDQSSAALDFSLYQGFTENLNSGFLVSEEPPLSPLAPHDYYSPYLRNIAGASYEILSTQTPPVAKPGFVDCCQKPQGFEPRLGGTSADARHVIFQANDAVAPSAIPGQENLYEWNEGQLETISILPNGTPVAGGVLGGFNESYEQNSEAYFDFYRAISTDGKRAFWTGPERGIYMHELAAQGPRTVRVGTGKYWAASSDGSVVYFGAAGGWEPGGDLYRYDVESAHTTDIAPGVELLGVLGASEDGSYIYFAGRGTIATGAVEGKDNLYVWHSTGPESGTLNFIAALNGQDHVDRENWYQGLPERTSRVSPNGQYLAFQSVGSLTGYDNVPPNVEQDCPAEGIAHFNNSGRCSEVYEYSAAANKLSCVSCNPNGFPPVGDSVVPEIINSLQVARGWESNTEQQRYLDDSGRLFFNSEETLVPAATNHNENVFEYDPNGVGSCASASGCIDLISSGTGSGATRFLDASEDGDDVFFVTYDQLVAQDGDQLADVYDARVDGGFSLPSSPACQGESCKPPNTPAPSIYGAPASAAFEGPGNPNAAPASATTKAKPKKVKPQKKTAKTKKRKATKNTKQAGSTHAKSVKKGKR
jgi:hypothetical protein